MTDQLLNPLIVTVMGFFIVLLFRAFGLSIARCVMLIWTRLIVLPLRPEVRRRRYLELESDLFEHQYSAVHEGYTPDAIALQILSRWVRGVPGDLAWLVQEHRVERKGLTDDSVSSEPALVLMFLALGLLLVAILGRVRETGGDLDDAFTEAISKALADSADNLRPPTDEERLRRLDAQVDYHRLLAASRKERKQRNHAKKPV